MRRPDTRRRLGRRGEARAARFLRRRGLRILARNWTCPLGELDIVAADGDQVVIVEVRTSRAGFAGGAAHTVGPDKRRRLVALAHSWMQRGDRRRAPLRFDVVALSYRGRWRWDIDWYRCAFEV